MHQPFKRIVPGAESAVLFVHGINATPRFFDEYVAALPEHVSVHSLLLPGHGGSVRDFGAHSAQEWEMHVRQALDALRKNHQRVYIMAHSLGTLLALREAVRDSKSIAWWGKLAKGLGGKAAQEELRTCYGTEVDWRIWRYVGWIPRYAELFVLSREVRRSIHRLKVPTCVFMAGRDEQVSLRSEHCMRGNPAITLRRMAKSTHHIFATEDKRAITAALKEMCQ